MVLLTVVVGVLNETALVPVAEPFGVEAVVLSHAAVAVFVPPISGLGADVYVQP